jgi:hypothetical protein
MKIPAFMLIDSTTCTIKRLTPDIDHEIGSPPGTFQTIASNVYCCLDRTRSISKNYSGGLDMSEQGESDQATFKLFVLSTEDIIPGDLVIVSAIEYKVNDVVSFSTHKEGILIK